MTPPTRLDELIDRAAITDTILAYATGIDRRDWGLYRSIFLPEVDLDFSSWSGEPRMRRSADDWVGGVARGLSGFTATQHQLTNFVITLDADVATATVYMVAHHHLAEGDQREMHSIGGYYTHRLRRTADGWKIAGCTLTVTWEAGDRALFQRAAKRLEAA